MSYADQWYYTATSTVEYLEDVDWNTFLKEYGIPILAILFSNGMYLAPMGDIRRARVLRTLGDLDAVTYAMQFVNCLLWLAYTAMIKNEFMFWGQAPGVFISLFSTISALELAMASGRLDIRFAVETIFFSTIVYGVILLYVTTMIIEDPELRNSVGGIPPSLATVFMFISPLRNLSTVIREKSCKCFSPGATVFTLLNCGLWTMYGIALQDEFVWASNGVGLITGSIQALAIMLYYGDTKEDWKRREEDKMVEVLKVAALKERYVETYERPAALLNYDRNWLADRVELVSAISQSNNMFETQETTTSALLDVRIPETMATQVLASLASEHTHPLQFVSPKEPTPISPDSGLSDELSPIFSRNQSVLHQLAEESHGDACYLQVGDQYPSGFGVDNIPHSPHSNTLQPVSLHLNKTETTFMIHSDASPSFCSNTKSNKSMGSEKSHEFGITGGYWEYQGITDRHSYTGR